MKRIVTIAALLCCSFFGAKASHLMGGEIVAKYDSAAGGYVVMLTHYRDTLGIPIDPSVDFTYFVEVSGSYTMMLQKTVQLNTSLSTSLLPSFPYGVEVGVYTDTISLTPGQYKIMSATCCRNAAILNMTSPGSESMVLSTNLTVDALNNSSPDFLAMPVAYFPVNQPATYNPLPYDPDGDSISWALNVPLGSSLQTSPNAYPVNGFVAPSATVSGPFSINPVTGEITWTPDTVGNFVQSFEVTEYKNGVATGTIIRDMQYVIVPGGGNSSPYFQSVTSYNTNTSQSYNYAFYNPGQPFSFQIIGKDNDPNAQLEMHAFSETFSLLNPATFVVTAAGGELTGDFNWTPSAGYSKDVLVVFRIGDGQFASDFTLLLKKNPLSVADVPDAVSSFDVYPNPAKNEVNLSMQLQHDVQGEIALYSVTGQKVKTIYSGKMMKGMLQLKETLTVASGVYYLAVKDGGRVVKTHAIVIQ